MPMIIDTQARSRGPARDQSGALHDALNLVSGDLEELFVASDEAVLPLHESFLDRTQEIPDSTFFQGSFALSDDAVLLQKEVRHVHEWFLVSATTEQELIDEHEQTRLVHKLHAAFEIEPLEDGMHHKAEVIIEQALQSGEDERILEWLREFTSDDTQPVFAASVLRCLGRQEYLGTSSWRSALLRDALASDDVEIRDAAVQAAELWGDQEILPVLKSHSEPEPWLQDYISDVIDDLGE